MYNFEKFNYIYYSLKSGIIAKSKRKNGYWLFTSRSHNFSPSDTWNSFYIPVVYKSFTGFKHIVAIIFRLNFKRIDLYHFGIRVALSFL